MEECLLCQDPQPVHALLSCLHPVCLACADDAVKNCERYQLPQFVCPLCCEPSPLSALQTAFQRAATPDTVSPEGALLLYENQEQLAYDLTDIEALIRELDVLLADLTGEQIELAQTLGGHFDCLKDNEDAQRLYDNLLQAGVFYYHTDIKVTQIQHDEAVSLKTRIRRCLDLVNAALVDAPLKKDIYVNLYGGQRVYSDRVARLDAWGTELVALAHKDVPKPRVTRAHVYVGPRAVTADNVHFCCFAAEFRHRKAPVPFPPGERFKNAHIVTEYALGLVYFCEQLTDDTLLVSDSTKGVVIYSLGRQPPVYLNTPKARRPCDVQICELRLIWVLATDARTRFGNALRRFSTQGEFLEDARLGGYAGCCSEFKVLPGGFILASTPPATPGDFTRVVRLFNYRDQQVWVHIAEPAAATAVDMLRPFLREFCQGSERPFLGDGIIARDMHDYGTCSTRTAAPEAGWHLPFRDACVFADAQDRVFLSRSSQNVNTTRYDSVVRQQQPPISDDADAAICALSGGRYAFLTQTRASALWPHDLQFFETELKILEV